MKNILLIYGALHLGGIETLIVRMAKAWQGKGIAVTVLLLSRRGDAALLDELGRNAKIVYLADLLVWPALHCESLSILNWCIPFSRLRVLKLLGDVDHIHFFDTFTMLITMRLMRIAAIGKKVTGGVYHQYEYAYARLRQPYFVRSLRKTFARVCRPENIFFFNEISTRTLSSDSGKNFSRSPIMPIGIDLSKHCIRSPAGTDRLKVVSIGRITSFKTYNIQFLTAMRKLKDQGICVTYHIYGDGDDVPALKKAIEDQGLSKQVFLHGTLPYSKFTEVIGDAFLFLGSGTALIEAAACGVPALIGIESQQDDQTYGFLHDIKGLSYHEKGLDLETHGFDHFYQNLAALSEAEYAEICERSVRKAKEFSMEIFTELFAAADASASTVSESLMKPNGMAFWASMIIDRLTHKRHKSPGFWTRYDA